MALSLILKEKIETTEAKAKEVSRFVEKKITRSRIDNPQNRRILSGFFTKGAVSKLFTEIGPRFKERKGGYTRIIKLGPRKSDGAKMAIIELLK